MSLALVFVGCLVAFLAIAVLLAVALEAAGRKGGRR